MKRRQLQWMLLTAIVSSSSVGAMILFERASMEIAEVLLTPWFAICRAVTPLAWQVRGNILLAMMWLFSGVVVYSMLISCVFLGCLALFQKRRQTDACLEKRDQSREVALTRKTVRYVLIFLALFSILITFATTSR